MIDEERNPRNFTGYVLMKVAEACQLASVDMGPLDAIIIITQPDPNGGHLIYAGSLLSPVVMRTILQKLLDQTVTLATPEREEEFKQMVAMAEGTDEPRH